MLKVHPAASVGRRPPILMYVLAALKWTWYGPLHAVQGLFRPLHDFTMSSSVSLSRSLRFVFMSTSRRMCFVRIDGLPSSLFPSTRLRALEKFSVPPLLTRDGTVSFASGPI